MTTPGADVQDPLEPVRAVFANSGDELGQPEAPTRAGLLALARAGKDVWNTWRAAWPDPRAYFDRVDFRESQIDFSGFVFGFRASFDGAQFHDGARFAGAQFGPWASFKGAQFYDAASFAGTSFGGLASFAGAQFGVAASFEDAQLGHGASFAGAQFAYGARFGAAQFGVGASFEGAQFLGAASFAGAQFEEDQEILAGAQPGSDEASFAGAQFGVGATFAGARFDGGSRFEAWTKKQVENLWRGVCVDEAAAEGRIKLAEQLDLRSDAFQSIDFIGVQFKGNVSFHNRVFLGTTKFHSLTEPISVPTLDGGVRTIEPGPTRFWGIPNFHGCTLHQDTSFEEAEFSAPATADTARAYGTLKLAMAQQQAVREEQRFFRLEMEAERATAKRWRRELFDLYKWLSDYGFSFVRPLLFWMLCLGTVGAAHGLLAGPGLNLTNIDWPRTWQRTQYVLINAVPLPGFDRVQGPLRTSLFGRDGVLVAAILLEVVHKTCALIALFLIGLALRNLFKIKG